MQTIRQKIFTEMWDTKTIFVSPYSLVGFITHVKLEFL